MSYTIHIGRLRIECQTLGEVARLIQELEPLAPQPEKAHSSTLNSSGPLIRKRLDDSDRLDESIGSFLVALRDAGNHGLDGSDLARRLQMPHARALGPFVKYIRRQLDQCKFNPDMVFHRDVDRRWRSGSDIDEAIEVLAEAKNEAAS